MANICFITGGQRSGKSRFAMELAEKESDRPLFLATARVWDEDFRQRILRHQEDRSDKWEMLEEDRAIGKLDLTGRTVVLDCITLWLNNIFYDNDYDTEKSLIEAKEEFKNLVNNDLRLIIVSNELGMGIHSENEASRKFSDLQGWMNQFIASLADEAFFMVSGIPLKLK